MRGLDKSTRAKTRGEGLDADDESPDVSFADIDRGDDADVQYRGCSLPCDVFGVL